jgi:SAM-dependent methyltransferase
MDGHDHLPDRFPDHFSAHADGYAAHRPTYPSALIDYLASIAPRTSLAWEAGCGSGQLSGPLAERFDRVIATDPSAEQLARAAAHPRVEYLCATAEDSGLPDACADLAVAAQAAHWFDLEAYYAEVRRVCAPGGAVVLATYGGTRIAPDIDPIVAEFRRETLRDHWAPERRHVEDGYRSLPFPFEVVEAPAMEIRLEWRIDQVLGYVRSWSALRGVASDEAESMLAGLRRRIGPAWGESNAARTVTWPVSIRAGYV